MLFACDRAIKVQSKPFNLVSDILLIDLPVNTSANLLQPATWRNNEKDLFAAYNYLDHSISVVNITDKKYITQIKLREDGPDFVNALNGLSYYGENRFVVSSDQYLTIINLQGRVLDRVALNSTSSTLQGFDFSRGRMEVSRISGLQFDSASGEVLLRATRKESDGRFHSYIASVNVSAKTIELKPIPNFESRNEGEYFGNIHGFHFRRLDKGFVLNPKYASELVLLQDDTVHMYMKSSLTRNKANTYSRQSNRYKSIIDHHTQSVEFYPVFSINNGEYFFRIHKGPIDSDSGKEPFYLMVTDRNLNVIREELFPENYYITPAILSDAVMFMAFNKHDDKLELLRYRFE